MTRDLALCALVLTMSACTATVSEPGTDPGFEGPVTRDVDDPDRRSVGPADHDDTRRVRRVTADQFYASLRVATGQEWDDYDEYANALGRPDLAEVTSEGRDLSVTFEKLVNDAARATCRQAIVADRTAAPEEATLLRRATLADREMTPLTDNLSYLFLRFLSVEVSGPDDSRLTPWLSLLVAPPLEGELTDTDMEYRWQAVCVGLVTHPDFLNY